MGVYKRAITNSKGKKVNYWYIRYSENGKIKRQSVGKVGEVTKDVARSRLEKKKKLIKQERFDEANAVIPTLNEIAPEFINYQKNIRQKRSYRDDQVSLEHLKSVIGNKKLSQITCKDIDNYKAQRLKNVTPATVNKELASLRRLFNLAKNWKRFYGENPVTQSGLFTINNHTERIITPEEEQRLLEAAPPHLRNILIIALNTGMRKGEIISLKWENVDLETNIITLEHTNTKSKKSRRIPINSVLRTVLVQWKLDKTV